jgi:hypothetical protein
MIPGKIVRFLEHHANQGLAGTRDSNLVPCGYRVSAWRLGPDGRTLTALIPEPLSDRLIESLLDNGQFAMTVEEHPTHETYQLKGRYLRHRPVEAGDLELVTELRERFARTIRWDIPEGLSIAYILSIAVPPPVLAVDVDVHEVYVQTPGPGAGARVFPPPDTGGPSKGNQGS